MGRFWPRGELSKPRQCSIAFLEPCCSSGMRTNAERVVAAVALLGTIQLRRTKVTGYSIRPWPVAELLLSSVLLHTAHQGRASEKALA